MTPDRKSVMGDAFAPRKNDADGLSVFLGSIHTAEEVGITFRGHASRRPAWVAYLRARDVMALGLSVLPDPLPKNDEQNRPDMPGHALIPALNYGVAKTDSTLEIKRKLAACVIRIDGPFDPPK